MIHSDAKNLDESPHSAEPCWQTTHEVYWSRQLPGGDEDLCDHKDADFYRNYPPDK